MTAQRVFAVENLAKDQTNDKDLIIKLFSSSKCTTTCFFSPRTLCRTPLGELPRPPIVLVGWGGGQYLHSLPLDASSSRRLASCTAEPRFRVCLKIP